MFVRIIAAAALGLIFWAAVARGSDASGQTGGSYHVRAGDTLWSISSRFYEGDPRQGVWQLQRQNGLSGGKVIVPGDRLRLPW